SDPGKLCRRREAYLRTRALTAHRLANDSDDHHQDAATHASAGYLADDGSYVQITGRGCTTAAEDHRQQLTADSAADDPRNRVAKGTKIILLQRAAGDVTANCPRDELNDKRD